MELDKDQQQALVRGDRARDFLKSDFWTEDLSPGLMQQLSSELPVPDATGWEEKYRAFWALSNATKQLMQLCESWVAQAERVKTNLDKPAESMTDN